MSTAFAHDPRLLQQVAESSPRELFFKGYFWAAQGRLLFILLIGGLIFYLLAPYTYAYQQGFILLTIFIQCMAAWGAVVTLRAIARVEVETAILAVIEKRAAGLLRAFKDRQIPAIELDKLEAEILPDNNSTPAPAMIRLFQHICKEARDRKFESSVSLIQPYSEEPLEDVFKLQNLQKIALWLGILGTFIGLMLAIREGNLSNLKTMDNFADIVSKMFNDLFIAFSASLAGLEVAVLLSFFLLLLRKKQTAYQKLMESSVVTMLSLARNALNRDSFLAEFSQASTAMSQLSESVSVQTTVLSNRLNDLQQQIIHQNKQIRVGLEQVMKTGQQFDGFLARLTDTQKQFLADLQGVYDVLALRNLGTTLQATIHEAGQHIAATIKPNVALVSTQLAEFNKAMGALSTTLQRQAQDTARGLQKFEALIKEQATANNNNTRELGKQLTATLNRAEAAPSSTFRYEVQELSRSVSTLNRRLDRAGNSLKVKRRSMREIFSSLLRYVR
jgi:MotA/TolQ/ExbB proton channel family